MNCFGSRSNRHIAFTLIELLVVIAVIAVLIAIFLPSLRLCREQAKRSVCANRIHQQYLGISSLTQDNNGKLLDMVPGQGPYPCDLTLEKAQCLQRYGYDKTLFYCPSNPRQTQYQDEMWEFTASFVHCGYWYVIGAQDRSQQHPGMRPSINWIQSLDEKGASALELIVDQTFSNKGTTKNRALFHVELGAASVPDQTNHMGNEYRPYGGNIGFLDGHTDWRPFQRMATKIDIGNVEYWW